MLRDGIWLVRNTKTLLSLLFLFFLVPCYKSSEGFLLIPL